MLILWLIIIRNYPYVSDINKLLELIIKDDLGVVFLLQNMEYLEMATVKVHRVLFSVTYMRSGSIIVTFPADDFYEGHDGDQSKPNPNQYAKESTYKGLPLISFFVEVKWHLMTKHVPFLDWLLKSPSNRILKMVFILTVFIFFHLKIFKYILIIIWMLICVIDFKF